MYNNIKLINTLIINGQDFKDMRNIVLNTFLRKKIPSLVAYKNMMKFHKVCHYYYNPFPLKIHPHNRQDHN